LTVKHVKEKVYYPGNVILPFQGENGAVSMSFKLEDDEDTRKMWNKK